MRLRALTKHLREQNWFAVVLDFVIVVFGVGVAMMGQQWLSEREQRADMALAQSVLKVDLVKNYSNAKERLALAECRAQSYRAIATQLLEPVESWVNIVRRVENDKFKTILPNALRSPSRDWGSSTWDAELGRGTFNQLDDQRRMALDSIFKGAQVAEELQEHIYTLQGRLKLLAVAPTISQSDRFRYYDVLAELDDKSTLLELIAMELIDAIEPIMTDLPLADKKELMVMVIGLNEIASDVYGDCYVPMFWSILSEQTSETTQ
jgi:hypothetical protein